MLSRKERCKLVRDQTDKEWCMMWWSFMLELGDELHWGALSINSNITMKDILENPDKPWNWDYISRNPNITMQDIKENPDKHWNWYWICWNPFTRDKQEYWIQEYRRHLASYRIQQHWHRIRLDPRHPVGQRRLEREYDRVFGGK